MNADGSGVKRLTGVASGSTRPPAATASYDPAWSPDGRKIAFMSNRAGNPEIYVMNSDGTGVLRLTNNPAEDGQPAWSPDGRLIAFSSDRAALGKGAHIYVMSPTGSHVTLLISSSAIDADLAWRPS
jgi:TolB protein